MTIQERLERVNELGSKLENVNKTVRVLRELERGTDNYKEQIRLLSMIRKVYDNSDSIAAELALHLVILQTYMEAED